MPSERVQRRIDRLLDQAEEALDKREWAVVDEIARSVLNIDPENSDAKSFIGLAEPHVGAALQTVASTESAPSKSAENSSSDQPTSFASGRYTVSRFLGEGGKKKVYLAHDNTLDRDVAFALIKTEGLDDTSRERVKREAQAMGRMGTHPCIMPIYDLGEEPDANGVAQPFMVQPLMVGGDVEGLIEDAEGPLALEDAIRIATQTAQGLVFAHGKGIVHRDLKPGNVWMDEDGAAKIGDFGLAVATDRSRLTVEKMMVGTVNYMPPEQATGGEVTPKADLYSLGAMLYEMATGRVPFMGDDDIAVISQHVNTPPVAPSWHNSAIPKTLDSLILRMMAKDPSERPADADEVLVALNAVDLSAVEERDESGKGSLDAMAGGVFVGRHKEMDQLKAGFEEVLSGKGRMVTLVGEPGIGKTRTAQELATYAAMRGAEVLWGRSYESGGAPPYWPWVQAIRSHVSATDQQTLRNQLSSTAPVIAEVVPDVKAKLPETPAPTSIEDPESARFRLFDSVSTFLKNTASSTPLVLMLEDLHWADKPSLMLLEFVARELANSRIMIVGNYRDMELNRRHPLSVTLGDLSRERLFERVVLRGLQKHDVQRFIEIAAGITPPPALVDTVFKQTEGNPLFVTETVRLLIQEGDITSGQSSKGGTTSWEIRIPEGVREVIGRRLDRLSERCNEVLTIAAVIGRQFRFDVLNILAEDTTDGQLLDATDEALSARIIEELPDEVGFYQFTHAQMQETLVQELSHTRAVRMHAQIAEALEAHYGDGAEEHAAELAVHFIEAETVLGTEKLVKYILIAGRQALDSNSNEESLDHYETALRVLDEGLETVQLAEALDGVSRSVFLMGPDAEERRGTVELSRRAFEIYVHCGDLDRAVDAASAPHTTRKDQGVTKLIEAALALVQAGSLVEGNLLDRYGVSLHEEHGRYHDAVVALERSKNIAQEHSDRELEAKAAAHLVQRHYLHDEFDLAADEGRRSSALVLSSRNPMILAFMFAHLPYVAVARGESEWASELIALSRQAAGEIHAQLLVTFVSWLDASLATVQGNWERARTVLASLHPQSGSREVAVNMLRCITDLQVGDVDQALKNLRPMLNSEQIATQDQFSILTARLGHLSRHLTGSPALDDFLEYLSALESKGFSELARTRSVATVRALTAIDQRDSDACERLYEELSKRKIGLDPFTLVAHDRILALLSVVADRLKDAEQHFQSARDFCRNAEYRPELAWICSENAEMLLTRNAPGDHEKAVELQDEAISIATDLGMKPLLERVLAKREILKA